MHINYLLYQLKKVLCTCSDLCSDFVIKSLSIFSYQDTVTKKTHKCKVAFQVLIEPSSYKVDKETLGFRDKVIDSEFKNSELEWSTKQYGSTILYGLLVKADPPQ